MFCLLQKRCCSTCLMTWNEWEGTRRMGARPRRGAAAGWGSSGQILPSCRCSPPAKKNNHCHHQKHLNHRNQLNLYCPPARTNNHHQHQKLPYDCHQHNCHHTTPARTYMIYHVVMTVDIISLMI